MAFGDSRMRFATVGKSLVLIGALPGLRWKFFFRKARTLQTITENVRDLFGQKARRMHDGKHGKPVFAVSPLFGRQPSCAMWWF